MSNLIKWSNLRYVKLKFKNQQIHPTTTNIGPTFREYHRNASQGKTKSFPGLSNRGPEGNKRILCWTLPVRSRSRMGKEAGRAKNANVPVIICQAPETATTTINTSATISKASPRIDRDFFLSKSQPSTTENSKEVHQRARIHNHSSRKSNRRVQKNGQRIRRLSW